MANRPDKPGYWWWETKQGQSHVVNFRYTDKAKNFDEYVSNFEKGHTFGRWLGPAHPPKRVMRYAFNEDDCVMEGGFDWYVNYDDFKEFILEE
jgi:hypothetical protein